MDINPAIWNEKRVLVTGHTGFKGSWLSMLLAKMGAEVVGISLPPISSPYSLYSDAKISKITTQELFLDIRNKIELERAIKELQPDYIFHLAAQAFVQKSVKDPYETITTNVNGTTNLLLAAFMSKSVRGITVVTTDKVYKNFGTSKALNESDTLGSSDPYSASKAASELIVASLAQACNPQGIPVSTVRAGNVVGGGDWGEDRLIPDLIRSLLLQNKLKIRNPEATRPWQHVLDCLNGYLLVAQSHLSGNLETPKSVNFGPSKSLSVSQLINILETVFKQRIQIEVAPSSFQEAIWLQLDSQLAHQFFGWQPTLSIEQSIMQAGNWYSKFLANCDAAELMLSEIDQYKVGKF